MSGQCCLFWTKWNQNFKSIVRVYRNDLLPEWKSFFQNWALKAHKSILDAIK